MSGLRAWWSSTDVSFCVQVLSPFRASPAICPAMRMESSRQRSWTSLRIWASPCRTTSSTRLTTPTWQVRTQAQRTQVQQARLWENILAPHQVKGVIAEKKKRSFLFGNGDKSSWEVDECLLYLCLGCFSGPAGRKLLRRDVQTSSPGWLPVRGIGCLEGTDHRRGACHHTRIHHDLRNLL